MSMEDKRVGFALTGSFCTFARALEALERVAERYREVTPILSERSASTDSRFGAAAGFRARIESICGRPAVDTVAGAEPIGPRKLLDVLVICPCTGNTLAKLAAGIADSSVTMAAKSHLRNGRPVVLAVSTNDGLAGAAKNIGALLDKKHIYFVPFGQDDPVGKPTSLVADLSRVPETIEAALRGEQIQPVLSTGR